VDVTHCDTDMLVTFTETVTYEGGSLQTDSVFRLDSLPVSTPAWDSPSANSQPG
jgi:hypothetical protein